MWVLVERVIPRRCVFSAILIAFLAASPTTARSDAPGDGPLTVVLDQALLIKLPERAATVVVGNPLIADIAVQTGGMLVITGKGYGETNVLALDRSGATLLEKTVVVKGPAGDTVVVYRGVERETYSCASKCEPRITLGDTKDYFNGTLTQTGVRNSLAQGGNQAR
jgi:Flp pilus assembly secretin CpaC